MARFLKRLERSVRGPVKRALGPGRRFLKGVERVLWKPVKGIFRGKWFGRAGRGCSNAALLQVVQENQAAMREFQRESNQMLLALFKMQGVREQSNSLPMGCSHVGDVAEVLERLLQCQEETNKKLATLIELHEQDDRQNQETVYPRPGMEPTKHAA